MSATKADIDSLKDDLIIIIGSIGGVAIGLILIAILIAIISSIRVLRIKKQLDQIHISLRSLQTDMGKTHAAIDRFPKNIVQFPMNKSFDDEDRSGTEPASPIFFRKGYSPTPLASSLTSVTEMPTQNQMIHHQLQRHNAMGVRPKQQAPPVPPKRTNSFSNHAFNY